MRLSIVIPAYNEEDAIESICERTKAAISTIISKTVVTDVHIVVVNDGSFDNTPVIARHISDISLISYEKNRGYGAAIKLGFEAFPADELVSFLDADGTCDPLFFIELINEMMEKKYDVVLGSRINDQSEMPAIRRLGNMIFAKLLNILAGTRVKDTASGMRVIKRTVLERLYPLPDGLHFTPAMSARAIFNKTISIGELPMPYQERIGESKLNPLKDGIRFLRVIIESAIQYAPSVIFNFSGIIMTLLALFLAFLPAKNLILGSGIEDWMIFRVFTSFVLFNSGILLFCTGQVAAAFLRLIHYSNEFEIINQPKPYFEKLITRHGMLIGLCTMFIAIFILYTPFVELLRRGTISADWWSFLLGELFFLSAMIFAVFGALGFVAQLITADRLKHQSKLR